MAKKSGFTDSNYTQLTELYNKYKEKGFEVLAFPCNQFLYQEPGTSQDAQEFACTSYKAEYPIFQKVKVNGPNSASIYKFLKAKKTGYLGSRIKWNFTKFLVASHWSLWSHHRSFSHRGQYQKGLGRNMTEMLRRRLVVNDQVHTLSSD